MNNDVENLPICFRGICVLSLGRCSLRSHSTNLCYPEWPWTLGSKNRWDYWNLTLVPSSLFSLKNFLNDLSHMHWCFVCMLCLEHLACARVSGPLKLRDSCCCRLWPSTLALRMWNCCFGLEINTPTEMVGRIRQPMEGLLHRSQVSICYNSMPVSGPVEPALETHTLWADADFCRQRFTPSRWSPATSSCLFPWLTVGTCYHSSIWARLG